MDEVLGVDSRREGRPKAALIREVVRDRYGERQARDALDDWVGSISDEPGDIDCVGYGE